MSVYLVKEHQLKPENYLVMEVFDFYKLIEDFDLAVFKDMNEIFTYYNGTMIVKEYAE